VAAGVHDEDLIAIRLPEVADQDRGRVLDVEKADLAVARNPSLEHGAP
jgi:hypothetical protein